MDNKEMSVIVKAIIDALYSHEYFGEKAESLDKSELVKAIKHNQNFRGRICDALEMEDKITKSCLDLIDELEQEYWKAHAELKAANRLIAIYNFCREQHIVRPIEVATLKEANETGKEAMKCINATKDITRRAIKDCFRNYLYDDGVVNKAYAFENYDDDEDNNSGYTEIDRDDLKVDDYDSNATFWAEAQESIESLKKKLNKLHIEEIQKRKAIQAEINANKAFMEQLEVDPEVKALGKEKLIEKYKALASKAEARCELELAAHYRDELNKLISG